MEENKQTQDISIGSLYDMNKSLMMSEPTLVREDFQVKIDTVLKPFFEKHEDTFFMLYCNELSDYTVFRLIRDAIAISDTNFKAATDVIECMVNRGEVLSIDNHEQGGIELWIRCNDDCHAYFLFPYDLGIVEVM